MILSKFRKKQKKYKKKASRNVSLSVIYMMGKIMATSAVCKRDKYRERVERRVVKKSRDFAKQVYFVVSNSKKTITTFV